MFLDDKSVCYTSRKAVVQRERELILLPSNLSVRPGILLPYTLNPSPICLNRDQFDSRFAKLTTICGSSEMCFFSPTRLLGRRLVVFGAMVETHSTPCLSQITQSTKLAHSLPPAWYSWFTMLATVMQRGELVKRS